MRWKRPTWLISWLHSAPDVVRMRARSFRSVPERARALARGGAGRYLLEGLAAHREHASWEEVTTFPTGSPCRRVTGLVNTPDAVEPVFTNRLRSAAESLRRPARSRYRSPRSEPPPMPPMVSRAASGMCPAACTASGRGGRDRVAPAGPAVFTAVVARCSTSTPHTLEALDDTPPLSRVPARVPRGKRDRAHGDEAAVRPGEGRPRFPCATPGQPMTADSLAVLTQLRRRRSAAQACRQPAHSHPHEGVTCQ